MSGKIEVKIRLGLSKTPDILGYPEWYLEVTSEDDENKKVSLSPTWANLGYVAFVIQPTQWNNDKKFEDHIIKTINIFEKNGFKEEMRYVLPYSSQQCTPQMVNIAKKEKFPLNLIRDLVVFKKQ